MSTHSLAQDTRIIGLVALAHGLSHFYQIVTAVLFPLIRDDLAVSYAALGATTAAAASTTSDYSRVTVTSYSNSRTCSRSSTAWAPPSRLSR